MDILVLSDNLEVRNRATPIFMSRHHHWTITGSDDINPKKDFKHIIDNYQLVFSLHCKKIFPPELVNGVRCVNIHPGFNPYNRGMYPHVWSIINGFPAGATIHKMDEGIDSGEYYYRIQVEMFDDDTSETLYDRILLFEIHLIEMCLDNVIDDVITTKYESVGNYNSLSDFKKLCDIDPARVGTFREFYDLMRALSHGDHRNAHIGNTYFKLITP